MKVKATVSFAGAVTMAMNEVRDLPDEVAASFLSCGYVVPAEETDDAPAPERKPRAKKSAKKSEEE